MFSEKKGVPKNLMNFTGKMAFSCEICEISKNMYLEEHLRTTASVLGSFKINIVNEVVNENML